MFGLGDIFNQKNAKSFLTGGLVGVGLDHLPGGGNPQMDQLMALYNQMGQGKAAQSGYSDFRPQQQSYIDQLRALSQGEGPSLASNMLNQAQQQATNNQFAQAAGGRGNPAMLGRQALNNVAGMNQAAQGTMANARVQEQLGALQQLGLGLYGARGQDESTNMFNAGQMNQYGLGSNAQKLQALMALYGMGQNQVNPSDIFGSQLAAFGQMAAGKPA